MVQIRKRRPTRNDQHPHPYHWNRKCCRQWIWGSLRFLLLSAAIPTLFWVRFSLVGPSSYSTSSSGTIRNNNNNQPSSMKTKTTIKTTTMMDDHNDYQTIIQQLILSKEPILQMFEDDFDAQRMMGIELYDYCDVSSMANNKTMMDAFLDLAIPLYETATTTVFAKSDLFGGPNPNTTSLDPMRKKQIQTLLWLELLEQFAQIQGLCDYTQYKPTVHAHTSEGQTLLRIAATNIINNKKHIHNNLLQPNGQYKEQHGKDDTTSTNATQPGKLVYIISAYQDVDQVLALIAAIQPNAHMIILHLEQSTSPSYRLAIQSQIDTLQYSNNNNVVMVQFGSVLYRTDSISLINLRILRWITLELQLEYDYVLLLDGSAFPLWKSSQLVQRLCRMTTTDISKSKRQIPVYLGELTHKGERVWNSPADHLLRRKRLFLPSSKWMTRLPRNAWTKHSNSETYIPLTIRNAMTRKSTSGNQGIYSHHVIEKLLHSADVMQLFALSKYGCCCCLEERNWIAALYMIGYEEDALAHTGMFQVWGGNSHECQGTMNNAVLSTNASICFRSEDPGRRTIRGNNHTNQTTTATSMYFYGNEMWDAIVDAKQRGLLFARKFHTDRPDSMEIRHRIQNELWKDRL